MRYLLFLIIFAFVVDNSYSQSNDSSTVQKKFRGSKRFTDEKIQSQNNLLKKNKYNNNNNENNSNGTAPIFSLFIPGGGHFFLGEYQTGALYAISEIGTSGGGLYCLLKVVADFPNGHLTSKERSNYLYAGLGLTTLSVGIKIVDIIHSARTAQEKNRQEQLSMGFDLDTRKQPIPKLTYSYNF